MKSMLDIGSTEIEQDAMEIEYGDEIMSAGWNPAVDWVCEQSLGTSAGATLSTSDTFETIKCLL